MLATRVPVSLRRRLRLYCIEHEVKVQDFVREALEDRTSNGACAPIRPISLPASSVTIGSRGLRYR
jgi:hypothetical protein